MPKIVLDMSDESDWESMLDELLDLESGLYGRELDFIDSLDQNQRGRALSDKQLSWLESIYERLCG